MAPRVFGPFALVFFALAGAVAASGFSNSTAYATKINFAPEDILDGEDGMPPHPLQPHRYGKPVYPVTADGDGLEMVESHLSYWEGKYWMYSATWGCGGSIFVFSVTRGLFDDYPTQPVYPPGDYGADGNCGIKSFSSADLTNWTLEDFYQPSMSVANVTKPLVRYSNETGLYVMIMGGDGLVAFYYATSPSPGGPWTEPEIFGGENTSHDFDVMVAPDGTHYMVADVLNGSRSYEPTDKGIVVFNIWVHQLAPNLTSTVGASNTSVLIRTAAELTAAGLYLEASSAFYYDGYYYLLFGMTCQNCAGYTYAYYATEPLGPYTDLGLITEDGCGGQNKGAAVLPTPDGKGIVVNHVLGYRTGPTNYVISQGSNEQAYLAVNNYIWHADNHQAASSTYWFPLEFNEDHTIKDITCSPTVQVPLVGQAASSGSPAAPAPYQLDCRVRDWRTIEATYTVAKQASTLEFPVWQRTDNLGPTAQAGPVLNGGLNITLTYGDGQSEIFSWVASNISWAPAKVAMDVGGRDVVKIALSTNATNGCYGTMVQPRVDGSGTYGSVVPGLGTHDIQEKAELYVYQW